jgi:hypothetical protein
LATIESLLKPYDQSGMLVLEAVHPQTSYIRNNGDGTFDVEPLSRAVQIAPINGIVTMDVNHDGNADILMTGNDYGNEVFSGRYDACRGILLLGDGAGGFNYVAHRRSGFIVEGDGKALARINTPTGDLIIATQNADSVRIFRQTRIDEQRKDFRPLPADSYALIEFPDGKKQRIEFYYGSGYLSQSTRVVAIPSAASTFTVVDYAGKSRVIDFSGLAQAGGK